MKIILPIATLLIATAIFLVLHYTRPAPELREPDAVVVPVEYVVAEKQEVLLSVTSHGVLKPVLESTIAAEVSGIILETSPQLLGGSFVERGEILLQLDPTNYEVALAEAEAGLLSARTSLEQTRADAEQAVLDLKDVGVEEPTALARREPQLLQAQAAMESAEASLLLARKNLERTRIKAPYDGQIREVLVQKGDVLTGMGSPVAVMYGTRWSEIRLPLSRFDLERLNLPDTPATVQAPPDKKPRVRFYFQYREDAPYRTGWIDRMEGTVDPVSRLRYAVARVEYPLFPKNPDEPSLPFGSFLIAKIDGLALKNAFVIPESALLDRNRVRIIDEQDQLREAQVEVVQRQNGTAVISRGLEPGDRICLTLVYPFAPGMKVEPTQADL